MRVVYVLAAMVGTVAYVAAQTPVRGGTSAAPPAAAQPDATRFRAVTLVPGGELNEPMVFSMARDGRAYIAERRGALKVYNPITKAAKVVTTVPVFQQNEQGFVGFSLDPNFATNRWVYAYYAHATDSVFKLMRWQLTEQDDLVPGSEKLLLEIPAERAGTNHTGGGMTWDARGNLFLTVGNNTGNSQFMQSDERPGRQGADDQRGAANSNDLRGKILRIHPEPDGTYTIPAGNMFSPGTPNTRPEIYTMGHRNVWRVSIDSRTGYIYWGEIGPDQAADTPTGPRGFDEFNQARRPGFFGWPYFVGDNQRHRFADYVNNRFGDYKDPLRPTNTSANNTGIRELPAAQPPLIWYPFGVSDRFPQLGSGARCAVGGPVYRRSDFTAAAPRPWPASYEGKWLITDCTRAWVKAVTLTDEGDFRSIEDVMPGLKVAEPMDMKFGPDGDLYILDYGSVWSAKSDDSKLVRIEYLAGNRAPAAVASASALGGTTPFSVTLRSTGSMDHDQDALTYSWTVSADGQPARVFRAASPAVSFQRRGLYTATLTVTDPSGASATSAVDIVAGNEAPTVRVNVTGNIPGNRMFFAPGRPLSYVVDVTDKEDGSLARGGVAPDRVAVSIDYLPEGFDISSIKQGQRPVNASTRFAVGSALMETSDCRACHNLEIRTRGPAMKELATKYRGDAGALDRLAAKVRSGGTGVWGTEVMPPHPAFSMLEARTMVAYMLSASETAVRVLPLSGTHTPVIPSEDPGRGTLLIRAVYTDKGAGDLPAQTSEAIALVRAGGLGAARADVLNGALLSGGRGAGGVSPRKGSFIAFRNVDLNGVERIGIAAQAQGGRNAELGGRIEIRRGSPTGVLLGTAQVPVGGGRGGAAAPAVPGAQAPATLEALGGPLDGAAGGGGRGGAGATREGGAGAAPVAGAGGGVIAPPPGAAGGGGGRGGGVAPLVRTIVAIAATTGTHDLYFVFNNDDARPTDPLMTISDVMLFFKD